MQKILTKEAIENAIAQLRAEGKLSPQGKPSITAIWTRCGCRGSMSTVKKWVNEILPPAASNSLVTNEDTEIGRQVTSLITQVRTQTERRVTDQIHPAIAEAEEAYLALERALEVKTMELDEERRRVSAIELARDEALAEAKKARDERDNCRTECTQLASKLAELQETHRLEMAALLKQLDAAQKAAQSALGQKHEAELQAARHGAENRLMKDLLDEAKGRLAGSEARITEKKT